MIDSYRKDDVRAFNVASHLFRRARFSLDQFSTAILHDRAVGAHWLKRFVSPLGATRDIVKRCRGALEEGAVSRLHTIMTTYPGATEPEQLWGAAAELVGASALQGVAEALEVNATYRTNCSSQWSHLIEDNTSARPFELDSVRLPSIQIIFVMGPGIACRNKLVASESEGAPVSVRVARAVKDREISPSQMQCLHLLEFAQHPVDSAGHRRSQTCWNPAFIDLFADRR